MPKTLYEKVGRRYIQVNDPGAYDGLPAGDWMVHVRPGSTSIRKLIKPDLAGFQAAAKICEEKMLEVMVENSKMRPQETLTPRQKAAWDVLDREMGHDRAYLSYPSMHDIVQEGLKVIQEQYESKNIA